MFLKTFHTIGKSFIDLLYPPLCLHCKESLRSCDSLLCGPCLQLMDPIDPTARCPGCFSDQFDPLIQRMCGRCLQKPLALERCASVFDHVGPAATLVKQLKYGGKTYLAKGLASYLAFQLLRLEWPQPDLILPMPASWLRKLDRGFNQSALLATELSKILAVPVEELLIRRCGGYSQAGLNKEQRQQLTADLFSLKKDAKAHDKVILIVDDVMTTGRSLSCCAEALQGAFPASIYGLTVCRAIE